MSLWKEHPITKEVFNIVNDLIDHLSDALINGETLVQGRTELETARIVGNISGLRQLTEIHYVEEDENYGDTI